MVRGALLFVLDIEKAPDKRPGPFFMAQVQRTVQVRVWPSTEQVRVVWPLPT